MAELIMHLENNARELIITPPRNHPPICAASLELADYCRVRPQGCWETVRDSCGRCTTQFVQPEPLQPMLSYRLGRDDLDDLDGNLRFILDDKINLMQDKMSGIIVIQYNNGTSIQVPCILEKRRVNTRIPSYSIVVGGCDTC